MAQLLKPLGLALLVALSGPALAQDSGTATDAETPAADAAPAEAPAADAAPAEAPAEDGPGTTYIDGVFGDWSRECVRNPSGEGADPCYMTQLLKDDSGRLYGKFSVTRIVPQNGAIAGAEIALTLELVPFLPAGVTLAVDKGLAKEFQYRYCTPASGCLANPNFSQADIDALKAGEVLNMSFAIVAQPNQLAQIPTTVSLKGFTAAYDALTVPEAPIAAAEAPAADAPAADAPAAQ